ncbi:MAG: hypothetical protein HOB42_11175 [Candidatus Marinimicrobia bacterium]|jgi:hypothetical protein|nr:hypothetical protein [Candidatus Neomarinimicrobiota bacterium]
MLQMMMMPYFKIKILFFTLLLFVLAVSCADIDTETSGYASLKINLDDVSSRKNGRSQLAASMTSSEAKTILGVLIPAVQCETSSASSSIEYSRALVDVTTHDAQFVVPLDTQVKLCLYFFSDTFSLNELGAGTNTADGFGESGIFTIDSETTAKTIAVEYWTTSYSTVTLKISSTSSAGLLENSTGTVKLNSTSGQLMDNQSFTITAEDNASKSVVFSDVVYSSYSYDVELNGFIPLTQAFLVSSTTETLDVKMTPNMVDLDWLSFDNMSITQVDTSAYAVAAGTLVLNVPNAQKDNVTQMLSLMQVKRVGLSNLVDVTPPIALSGWSKSEGSDNVTYTTEFLTANSLPLVHGSNELQVIITVNEESKTQTMGTVDYDACVDNSTMCFTLSWTDGLDPDLHSYYFPDWAYNEETTNGSFDNTSRGNRYWVYSNAAYKTYSETGDVVQLLDGNSASDTEVQVWATDSQKVGNGTYLVYVEDVSETDVQNFKLILSGPGLSDNVTYGPYNFKNDNDNTTTEATNPQAIFFIQVENNSIVRTDNITIGDNLSSTLMQWTGSLQNSVVE